MSNGMNGRLRSKPIREAYVDQSPYSQNKKRKSFSSLHSYDDTDIAYRSTPEYLKQLMNTSNSARSITRTSSVTDMTPRNIGNPKYKAQEDYYDEIQSLKKELKYFKDDNSNLRARIRRLEEDNTRKRKEIDNLYETNNNDSRRASITSSTIPTNNVVMNLKQRLFKLESQVKQKDTTIEEMKNDPRWTKGTELEIQNRALFNEIEKQKIEKLNFIKNNYTATLEEEQKNAIRTLGVENQELKVENKNLKDKVRELEKIERNEQLSARQHEKIEDLKNSCRKFENKIDLMKDDLKEIRRERDKYHDKFDDLKENFEEIKRERDRYRQKLNRLQEIDEHERDHRSSPILKRDDTKRSQSFTSRRDLHSPEEHSRKDSRPTTPIRKFSEHTNPRSSITSKKSLQNLRFDDQPKKNIREEHAATVIQRSWRKHNNLEKRKTKHDSFDKRGSRMASPRTSQQKLGSKIDNFGSGMIKNRPSSATLSNDSALKIVQAALRGCINRNELDKSSRIQKPARYEHDDDDDEIIMPSDRQYGSDRRRDNFIKTNTRDSASRLNRTPSPPIDYHRSSPSHFGSKQNLINDRNKLEYGHRFPMNDHELPSKTGRSPSPPRNTGSRQSLYNDKNKFGSNNRLDRESSLKSSPSTDRRISPENPTRQSNTSLRKNPIASKQSLKTIQDDDEF